MKKSTKILALETTCDETSVALLEAGLIKDVLTRSQIKKFAKLGGVVPQMASELHVQNLPLLIEQLMQRNRLKWTDIDLIAYAAKPGLTGCLQIAKFTAQTIQLRYQIAIMPINHVEAHYWIAAYQQTVDYPFLGIVVSGGHTQLSVGLTDQLTHIIGNTKDDAAGECLDKIARYLNLPYPGGPIIEQLAQKGKPTYQLQVYSGADFDFSFSGLKTFCIQLIKRTGQKLQLADFAASLQEAIFTIIQKKSLKAVKKYKIKTILAGGGVMANRYLRNKLTAIKNVRVLISPPTYCTDNAAMIAYLAFRKLALPTKI